MLNHCHDMMEASVIWLKDFMSTKWNRLDFARLWLCVTWSSFPKTHPLLLVLIRLSLAESCSSLTPPRGEISSAECYFIRRPHLCPSVIILFLECKMVMACRCNWRIWGLTMSGGMKWCSLHLRICRRTYWTYCTWQVMHIIFSISVLLKISA